MSRAATWTARVAALAALASLLAACHTTRVVWAKPGGDAASLQDDMQTCNYHPAATAYRPAAAPGYQPLPTSSGYSAGPMAPAYSTPANAADATNSVTIDAPDAQRSPVSCMIAHGWRLTPLP